MHDPMIIGMLAFMLCVCMLSSLGSFVILLADKKRKLDEDKSFKFETGYKAGKHGQRRRTESRQRRSM